MEELNLAENLGLSTNNRYQNQMPFTRAANTELNLAIQQKREEQKRAEQERQMQKEIANRIKFKGGDLDKIGMDLYNQKFTKAVIDGFTPEQGYELEMFHAQQKDEANALKGIKSTVDKLLLPSDVKAAFKNDDYDYLRKKAQQNPELGIMVTPSGRPLIDANRMVQDVNVDNYFSGLQKQLDNKDEYWLPKKNGKVENKFGRVLTEAVLRPEVYQQEANKIFTIDPSQSPEDQTLERNYLIKRQKEIDAELAKPIYKNIANDEERLITAAKNVFINEAKSKVTKFVENKVDKGSGEGKGKYFIRENGVIDSGSSNGFTFTPEGDATYIVNTKGAGGIGAQTMVVIPPPTPIEINGKQALDANGKPMFQANQPKQVVITPSKVQYLGGDRFRVLGTVNGSAKDFEANEQSLKSFFSEDAINKIKEANGGNPYKSNFDKPKTSKEVTATQKAQQGKQTSKTISTAEFKKMTLTERAAFKNNGGQVK